MSGIVGSNWNKFDGSNYRIVFDFLRLRMNLGLTLCWLAIDKNKDN